MKLKEMTKASWETKKKAAGIKSAKWYEKAHADVGGYIDKMQKARTKYKAAKTPQNVKAYNSAVVDLNKAFGKFVSTKDFTAGLGDQLRNDILAWQVEAANKSEKLRNLFKNDIETLQKNDLDDLYGRFDDILGDK